MLCHALRGVQIELVDCVLSVVIPVCDQAWLAWQRMGCIRAVTALVCMPRMLLNPIELVLITSQCYSALILLIPDANHHDTSSAMHAV